MKVLVIAGFADSLLTFRGPLIQALLARGCSVHVAAPGLKPGTGVHTDLVLMGVVAHDVRLHRVGKNPLADVGTLLALHRLMRRIRPALVLGYTIKPVIYGAFAAKLAGVPRFYALITGLGHAFLNDGAGGRVLQGLVQRLYAASLKHAKTVFFQNPDDEALFRSRQLLPAGMPSQIVNGSGVDVSRYAVAALPQDRPRFLLIARLLGEKGVREYAAAAKRVRARYPHAEFALIGWIDENPSAIAQRELDQWVADGDLVYLGRLDDVRPAIAQASVYVLPSYREGTPRTVLEAMAMGRAIITTDAPGCRETVVPGVNGFLVPVKSVDELAEAMTRFIENSELVRSMGAASRRLAEEKYDVNKVNAVMLHAMGVST